MEEFENKTCPNPDGFFPEITDSNACSVSVAVRVRPLVGRELSEGNKKLCIFPHEQGGDTRLTIGQKSFTFDRVFWSDDSQEHIFDTCTRNLILGCFSGFNATILAYGQTGSGKTHSMGTGSTLGIPFEKVGIVPRVFKFIFDELELRKAQSEYCSFKVKIAFLELYNEELHDLLDPQSMIRDRITGKPSKELTIHEEKTGLIYVRGLKEIEVTTQEECLHMMNTGITHRVTSATNMNEGSSRSHAIFTVTIEQKTVKDVEAAPDAEDKAKSGQEGQEKAQVTEEVTAKFHFVDLAGSERIKKTGATGQLMKEGISINKGLLCLGQVISALTEDKNKKEHIPYRDSKLTRILQDSLGGNSRTTMIACVSPAESNYEETLSTIKYASRARNIKNKPIVNRDPNSMLIESLRNQISNLQLEIREYVVIIQTNGIDFPDDMTARLAIQQKKQQDSLVQRKAIQAEQTGTGPAQAASNSQEVKDLKIKLSHKEKEIRELTQKQKDQSLQLDQKEKAIKDLEKERDSLALQNESFQDKLKANNIEIPQQQVVSSTVSQAKGSENLDTTQKQGIIDTYKAKLNKAQKDLDQKIREMQEKDNKMADLKQQLERNEKMLKKQIDENQNLKRQGKSSSQVSNVNSAEVAPPPKPLKDLAERKKEMKAQRDQRKEQVQQQIEDFNQKFLNDLENQIEDMLFKKPMNKTQKVKGEDESTIDETKETIDQENTQEESKVEQSEDQETQEREKILEGVRKYAVSMQSDIKDLLKNEWAGAIKSLENEKEKAENLRKEGLAKAKNDDKAVAMIEKDFKQKMENLNTQVSKLEKEKREKEEAVAKKIALQETRIKALEADVEKQKKQREEIEKAKKFDENRFFKFKETVKKDQITEKKKQSEKDKTLQKLKNDYKKVDTLAQQAIAQLRGLQKRSQEEKAKRDLYEQKDLESKGIDLDLIKQWILDNTEAMLKQQELKEYQTKQIEQKDKLENEMLEEGDRLTEILVQKEKLLFEKEELEEQEEKDEGRILEIDDIINDLDREVQSITDTLDSLQETLEFVQSKLNQVVEEIQGFDLESVSPLSFNALDSIESAKATLKIFFQVVLELNIYKRDLENKCLEQDEAVITLTAELNSKTAQIQFMQQNGGHDGYAAHVAKQNAITSVLKQVDGYLDNRDVEHLNLNPAEQTNLTKLSLSKIVNNLKNKLKEQESKNQSISLKLDQALKQKEIYKSRCDELKSQQKALPGAIPKSRVYSNVTGKLNAHEQQNSASLQKPLSFKERQIQKQSVPLKPVESLADRRKNRRQVNNLGEDDELGNEYDKLLKFGENKPSLDEILEDEEEENIVINKKQVKLEIVDEDEPSRLEPSQNPQQSLLYLKQNDTTIIENSAMEHEEWLFQNCFELCDQTAPLVSFSFLNTKIMAIFENFEVKEVDLRTKEVSKSYNLQEIEGFELDEEIENPKVRAFALEKDVQLIAVADDKFVHIFEYSEEDPLSLTCRFEMAKILQMEFAQYTLVLLYEAQGGEVRLTCWELEEGKLHENGYSICKNYDSEQKVFLQTSTETQNVCVLFAIGTVLGKVEVPSLQEVFKVETGHTQDIIAVAVDSKFNQIITSSLDGSIRFFEINNGNQSSDPMEEMGCDALAAQGLNLITRLYDGSDASILVWQLKNSGVNEDPIDEIAVNKQDHQLFQNAQRVIMKSGVISAGQNDYRDTDQHLIAFQLVDEVIFKLIAKKLSI